MRRYGLYVLLVLAAAFLATSLASSARADCLLPDPLRDAAFASGRPSSCPLRLNLRIPEGRTYDYVPPQTEVFVSVAPVEYLDSFLAQYYLFRGHRTRSGIEPTLHGLPVREMKPVLAIGITIRR